MNIFKSFIQWRQKKAMRKAQINLLKVFAIFEQAQRSRLLFIDEVHRRVLLSDMLTAPFAVDRNKWERFFENLSVWFRFTILQNYWERKRIETETAAIRTLKQKYVHLTPEDIQQVRVQARANMKYEQPEDGDKIFAYDFCICEGLLRTDTKAEAIGRWKNGHISLSLTE